MRAAETLTETVDSQRVVLVVNKAPSRPYYQAEIRAEMAKALPGFPLAILPFDRRLNQSAWEGSIPVRGGFIRAVKGVARVITEVIDDD